MRILNVGHGSPVHIALCQGGRARDTWLHELLFGFVSQSPLLLAGSTRGHETQNTANTKRNIVLPSQSMHVRT